jgi:hypothetical protein
VSVAGSSCWRVFVVIVGLFIALLTLQEHSLACRVSCRVGLALELAGGSRRVCFERRRMKVVALDCTNRGPVAVISSGDICRSYRAYDELVSTVEVVSR